MPHSCRVCSHPVAASCLFLDAPVKQGRRGTLSLQDLHWDLLLGHGVFCLWAGTARNRLQLRAQEQCFSCHILSLNTWC